MNWSKDFYSQMNRLEILEDLESLNGTNVMVTLRSGAVVLGHLQIIDNGTIFGAEYRVGHNAIRIWPTDIASIFEV